MAWRVSATIDGKRMKTECGVFKTKEQAQKYAKDTAKNHKGSRPRVINDKSCKL